MGRVIEFPKRALPISKEQENRYRTIATRLADLLSNSDNVFMNEFNAGAYAFELNLSRREIEELSPFLREELEKRGLEEYL